MAGFELTKFSRLIDMDQVPGDDLVHILQETLAMGHVSFCVLKMPGIILHANNYGYTTFSAAWQQRYAERRYWQIDPAMVPALTRTGAYLWADVRDGSRKEANQEAIDAFWSDAADHGISDMGLSIPIHGPQGDSSVFSVVLPHRPEREEWQAGYLERLVKDLVPLAAKFHDRKLREYGLTDNRLPDAQLSNAEREALFWISQGKTAAEAACILGKSRKTVEFQLAACRRKLGAITIAHAVTQAIHSGLIETRETAQNSVAV